MAKSLNGWTYEDKEGNWWARINPVGKDGKRRNLKRKCENKTEAKKALKKMISEWEQGDGETLLEGSRLTLNAFLDRWLENVAKPRLSERTADDYKGLLKRYVRPALGKKKLSHITLLDIQTLYNEMQKSGGLEQKPLSPRVVRYTHSILRSAFQYAVKSKLLRENPCTFAELPKQQRKEMAALTPEGAGRFLKACEGDAQGLVFIFALLTGMRPSEYLALRWSDIDFLSGIAVVQRSLYIRRKGKGFIFQEPKTARSRRSIPLPASLLVSLKEHRREQLEQRLKAGSKWQDYDLVFASETGTPQQSPNLQRRHFKPILKAAELPETIRLYDLRHSCATLLIAANENIKIVSERLGHSSAVLTLDVYSHVSESMQRGASDKLDSILQHHLAKAKQK